MSLATSVEEVPDKLSPCRESLRQQRVSRQESYRERVGRDRLPYRVFLQAIPTAGATNASLVVRAAQIAPPDCDSLKARLYQYSYNACTLQVSSRQEACSRIIRQKNVLASGTRGHPRLFLVDFLRSDCVVSLSRVGRTQGPGEDTPKIFLERSFRTNGFESAPLHVLTGGGVTKCPEHPSFPTVACGVG